MIAALSSRQKLLLALLLVLFATLKIAALWWWRQAQPTTDVPLLLSHCPVRQGCILPNGSRLHFGSQADAKTPVDIMLTGAPANTRQVTLSFSMHGMDMGFNRYTLQRQPDGSWLGRQIRLPLCVEQRNDYLADIRIDQATYTIPFTVP